MTVKASTKPFYSLKSVLPAASFQLCGTARTFTSTWRKPAKGKLATGAEISERLPSVFVQKRRRFTESMQIDHRNEQSSERSFSSTFQDGFPGPPSTRKICPEPIKAVTQSQISLLDPTGSRTKLFSRENRDAAKVGDVLLVKQKTSDPFAGVCIDIRRRGVDTAICLRNSLTRVGVEVWFKIYSPTVESIEIAQRKEKRARRARLYYMRKPKHDIGSVANIVHRYQRDRIALLGSSSVKGRDANSQSSKPKGGKS